MPEARLPPLRGLAPIIDDQARILLLGSFPSPASLAAGQYYAHRQNQFWRLLGAVLGYPLADCPYPVRQQTVQAAGLAIWDVFIACTRAGSLDSAIRNGVANDFSLLPALAPHLTDICFNGRTAARFEPYFRERGYATVVLPSSSPAYTLSFEKKLALWQDALKNRRNNRPLP